MPGKRYWPSGRRCSVPAAACAASRAARRESPRSSTASIMPRLTTMIITSYWMRRPSGTGSSKAVHNRAQPRPGSAQFIMETRPPASLGLELGQVLGRQPSPLARLQVLGELQLADLPAMQALDAVANGRDHALDLVVLAFGQREVQHMLAHLLAGSGLDGLGVIVEHHAVEQALHLAGIDRMLGGHAIDLGLMLLGRAHAVDELAVIAEQQQARRVLVQPPHGLHALHGALVRTQRH